MACLELLAVGGGMRVAPLPKSSWWRIQCANPALWGLIDSDSPGGSVVERLSCKEKVRSSILRRGNCSVCVFRSGCFTSISENVEDWIEWGWIEALQAVAYDILGAARARECVVFRTVRVDLRATRYLAVCE